VTAQVSVSRLVEADGRCLDAAEILLDSLSDHPSPIGLRRFEEATAAAREISGALRPGNAFERLLARHLLAGWELLESVVRYRFDWPRRPVAGMVEALAGEGAVARLEEFVAGIDPEEAWDYIEYRQRYRPGRVPVGLPAARCLVDQCAARLATGFRDWLAGRGWELPGLDAEVVVGADDAGNSWFQPQSHRVVLGGAEFMVFAGEGGFSVNPVTALHSLAHELAGHAVQDALSRDLPAPLQPDDRARLRFGTLPAAEGFASHATSLALAFAEEEGERHGIGPEDVELLRKMVRLAPLHHGVPALATILAARGRQEPGFDAAARLRELCGHGGFGELVDRAARQPANKILYECACYFGAEAVRAAAAALAERGVTGGEAWRRLGRGAWALSCYDEAVLGP
jgi:hypothetical protein